MVGPKKQSEQHVIDREGQELFKSKLPKHWVVRTYQPDYGLDFTIETFDTGKSGKHTTYETLGEHLFVQLKTAAQPDVETFKIFARVNVEKARERLNRKSKVADIEVYSRSVDTPELVTVERMGVGIPVLLVLADLAKQRCSFVCLNDYIDKILIPRHGDYRRTKSRSIQIPVLNEIGTEHGLVGLRWYAKRPKLLAAFQRFTYQFSELNFEENGDWRALANIFASKIAMYDFWDNTEMCAPIPYCAAALRRFIETGQPGLVRSPEELSPELDQEAVAAYVQKMDVYELWRQLSLLPKGYEDVWREWFLPTGLGWYSSIPDP